jgi:putative thioredoxin
LSIQQLSRQQYEAALEGLLKLFVRNRGFNEGAAHKSLLQVFELLGNDHPLVTQYRRRLFAALY